ncbi:MAG: hypothetical protein Q7U75_17690, partial [Desulfobacterales bacterium]|nr:hypothetical protein [Desulfobacterales bacterium]
NPNGFIGPVNLGNPSEFTIRELAEKVIGLTGSRSKVVFKPLPADDPTQRRPDIGLARQQLGWESQVTFEKLVEEMVRADLKEAERDALCLQEGFKTFNHYET